MRFEALEVGADDVLDKPIVRDELLSKVRVRLARARLSRERAEKDLLTTLLLRRPFLERLSARLAEAQRHGRPLTVCLLDIDHFKSVNDKYGHFAGDRVLSGLGKLLQSRLRAEDLRGRWGGEEFVLAFFGETMDAIQGVVTGVLRDFSAMRFAGEKGEVFGATFSAGMATFPEDGKELEALLKIADSRLYKAKEAGRNRVISWD